MAAKIAGGVAAAVSMEGDCSAVRFMEYDRLWRAALGRELEIGMRVNRMLSKMSAAELDELGSFLAGKSWLIKAIEEPGISTAQSPHGPHAPPLDWDAIRLARLRGYVLR